MTDDQPERESGFRRLIREAKEEAFHARRELRRELPEPSVGVKRRVAEALADYRDALWDYHEERVLQTAWDERDVNVDAIDELLSETVTVQQPVPYRRHATSAKEVPKVADASASELFQIGKELDAIAKELGFAASARDQTPSEEATMDDLRGLLKSRGQSEALEQIPDPRGDGE
jgi:hypothetical protein